jgi:cytoskeletal protein RodZ
MDKKKFDKIMDEWAAREMEAAPDLKPSPEVYQRLEEKKKKPQFVLFSWPVRLAAAGIAAALILLVIVLRPPREVEPLLGLREGTVTEITAKGEAEDSMRLQVLEEAETEEQAKDIGEPEKVGRKERAKIQEKIEEGAEKEKIEKPKFKEPPVETKMLEKAEKAKVADKENIVQPTEVAARPRMEIKPEKKELKRDVKSSQIAAVAPAAPTQMAVERMEFHYQPAGSDAVERLDIDSLQDEIVSLSSEDNYRLVLQLPQVRYAYVFQIGADKQVIRLFPNTEYNPAQNPLQPGKPILIPMPPNWFYVEKDSGDVSIFVVTSAEPLQDWDELYTEYSRAGNRRKKQEISTKLLDRIDMDKQSLENQVSVRVFKFRIRER